MSVIPLSFIIDSAINLNYNNRAINAHVKETIVKPRWLKEFCTIQINCGRVTGKTEYIQSKINDNHTLVITYDRASKREYEKRLTGSITNIFTYFSDNPHIINNFKDVDLNNIWYVYIDEPKLIFREYRHLLDFYITFTHCKSEPTFIMLGE